MNTRTGLAPQWEYTPLAHRERKELRRLRDQQRRLMLQNRRMKLHQRALENAVDRYKRLLAEHHHVWCSGGCVPRNMAPLDEETVQRIERETQRLRTKWNHLQYTYLRRTATE